MMIAELVSFQNLLRRNIVSESSSQHSLNNAGAPPVYTDWWSSESWAQGWSRGSIVFFTCSALVLVTWTLGEVIGYMAGASYGNVWMSLGSVSVNVGLFVGIVLFLSTGATTHNNNAASDDNKGDNDEHANLFVKLYAQYFQKTLVKFLGSSGGGGDDGSKDQLWRGRLLFLRNEISQVSAEATLAGAQTRQSLEALTAKSEAHVRGDLSTMEQSIRDLAQEQRGMQDLLNRRITDLIEATHKLDKTE